MVWVALCPICPAWSGWHSAPYALHRLGGTLVVLRPDATPTTRRRGGRGRSPADVVPCPAHTSRESAYLEEADSEPLKKTLPKNFKLPEAPEGMGRRLSAPPATGPVAPAPVSGPSTREECGHARLTLVPPPPPSPRAQSASKVVPIKLPKARPTAGSEPVTLKSAARPQSLVEIFTSHKDPHAPASPSGLRRSLRCVARP